MNIRKYIPNTITSLSLVSGCVAIVMALENNIPAATIWIIIAAVLDFLDGLAARLLKAYSAIGKDLDSLADVISFGVAPGMMLFQILRQTSATPDLLPGQDYLPYFAFIIPALSGLRLAKFNNDTRQSTSFIGMPVPAHALLWCGICYTLRTIGPSSVYVTISLIAFAVITSFLLVSEIPMFSLKVKSLKWKGNELRYLLLISGILFIALFGFMGLSATIILYVLLSLIPGKRDQ